MGMMFTFFMAIAIGGILLFLAFIIGKKNEWDDEKDSPFECGFEPMNESRLTFSMRFFLIAVIFLVFDVEIALLLPIIPSMNYGAWEISSWVTIFFLLILFSGTVWEWKEGALDWKF